MAFVIPPTFSMPAGNPQALAELGQALVSFGRQEVGDEQRDRSLAASASVSAATGDLLRSFWIGQAADRYGRNVLASRDRLRNVYRNLAKGGEVAVSLAEVLAAAQASIQHAHQTAQYRAQQAAASPVPVDPATLWGDLWSLERATSSNLAEAHRQAATAWGSLTRSAPHHVAKEAKAGEAKRPWWKKVESVLDKAGYIPGPIGMLSNAGMVGFKLAQGDLEGAGGYALGVAPGGKQVMVVAKGGLAIKGAAAIRRTDGAADAARHQANVHRSVGGVPGAGGRGPGGVNGPGGRPNNLPDPAPNEVPTIPKVGGARGDAGTGAGHQHPGQPRNPFGWPQRTGPADAGNAGRQLGGRPAGRPRPDPFRGLIPRLPTIVFPKPRPGFA